MRRRAFMQSRAGGALALVGDWDLANPQTGNLADAFRNPPASAHNDTWWHWMDGDISNVGITRDLEAMQRVGVRGFPIFQPGTGVPKGPVRNGRVVLPDLMTYHALVLRPNAGTSLETPRKIRDLVNEGMVLVGSRPEKNPGLTAHPQSDQEYQRVTAGIWGDLNGSTVTERAPGRGRVFWGATRDHLHLESLRSKGRAAAGIGPGGSGAPAAGSAEDGRNLKRKERGFSPHGASAPSSVARA